MTVNTLKELRNPGRHEEEEEEEEEEEGAK